MSVRAIVLTSVLVAPTALAAPPANPGHPIRPAAHRNLFSELLGKSDIEVDAKLEATWRHLFYGQDANERVYYPVAPDLAYIADTGNDDVRSEGMSYGLMIAVQTDHREEFDRLWAWTKRHMYHTSGPRRGHFAWHCTFDGRKLDPNSASDGEEWFAMALLFASHRWGSTGSIDYGAEGQALLEVMLHKSDEDVAPITSIFDRKVKQVVFVPEGAAATFTDPSYHLPAFYELWARWAKRDGAFWAEAATASREFFRKAAHPRTGLMPEYANFDGTPRNADGRGDFRFDAWRTLANVALDHAWFGVDPWQVEQSNRVVRFLASHGTAFPNQYTLDGKPLSTDWSLGLLSTAAVAGLAADADVARPFVSRLWDAKPPSGKWRYYDGLLYFLALLQTSGRFQIHAPQVARPAAEAPVAPTGRSMPAAPRPPAARSLPVTSR